MSDDIREEEGGEAGFPVMPSVGAQLKAAREARGMGVGDVAQVLKLGTRQVDALENGDWQALPGITFIRGFVRNYARLVQVDAAALMEQLDAILEAPKPRLDLPETTPAALPASGHGHRRDYAVALFGIGLVALAIAIYFLMPGGMVDLQASLKSVSGMFERQPEPVLPAATSQPEPVLPPGSTTQEVLNPQAVPVGEPGAAAPAAVQGGPAAAVVTPILRLIFEKESWVEVRDRSDKVLFSQRGMPGAEHAVEGSGPFSIVVGYAPGVRVLLRGQAVDLAPHARGDVARLTLD